LVVIASRAVACVTRPEKFFPGSLSIETISEIAHAAVREGIFI
jgi:hypothetical protein